MRVRRLLSWISIPLFVLGGCSQEDPKQGLLGPMAAIGVDPNTGASIETNQDDYVPGEIVHLVMKGWAANEDVRLFMTEDPETHSDVDTTVTVDANGEWSGHFYDVRDHDLGVTFTLTATGLTSGSVATAVFYDGNLNANTTLALVAPAGPPCGAAVSPPYAVNVELCTKATLGITTTGGGGNPNPFASGSVRWFKGTTQKASVNFLNKIDGEIVYSRYTPTEAGTDWSVKVCNNVDNTNNSCGAVAATLNFTVTASVATSTTVSGAPNPSVTGESVTFTATVLAGVTPVTTGTVDFRIGGTDCTDGTVFGDDAALNGSGQATANRAFNATETGATIRACYSGATGSDPSSGTTTQTVNKASTEVTLSDTPDASVFGESVTLSATVTAVSPGAGTPTGTVTFYHGGTSCSDPGTSLGSDATAPWSISVSSLAASASDYTLRACYAGDDNFLANGDTDPHTVNKASTLVTLSDSPDPSVTGQSVTLTATVTAVLPGVGTPTGTVTFYDGGTCSAPGASLGSDALAPWSTSVSSLTVAGSPYTLLACYSGDDNFLGNDDTEEHTVNAIATATTVSGIPNPSVTGQSVTFTATVLAGVTPVTTGTVDFRLGGTDCTDGTVFGDDAALNGSGEATASRAFNATETGATIRACYSGASGYSPSSETTTQTVNKANTLVTLSDTPDPSVFGQSITLSATVTAVAPGAGTPTGTVTFYHGGTSCTDPGTSLGSDGTAPWSISVNSLAASTSAYTLRACYSGDDDFNGNGDTEEHTVDKASTELTLTDTPDPTVFGQSITISATVAAVAPGAGTPTGTVTFYHGGTSCDDPGTSLGSDATAPWSISVSSLAPSVSAYTLRGCYAGDGNFLPSGGTNPHTVNKASTLVTLSDTPDPSAFGQSVTFSATVTAVLPGVGTPTGTVTFYDGGTCTTPGNSLGSDATAPWSVSSNSLNVAGSPYTLLACYSGDDNFLGNGDTEGHAVNAAGITSTASVDPTSQQYSDKVSLSTVLDIASPGTLNGETLTGSVEFFIGTRSVGTVAVSTTSLSLTVNLTPTTALTENPTGSPYAIKGVFTSTNSNFTAGTRTDASLTVTKENGAIFDVVHPNPVNVPAGGSGTFSITFKVKETNPDLAAATAAPGDLANATARITLTPFVGSAIGPTVCTPGAVSGTLYNQVRPFTCNFTNVPVETYQVLIEITGNYYTGSEESVLLVSDPSLGFVTGGGTYEFNGDRVNFGFVGKAVTNKNNTVYKGNVLVIRHKPNGDVIRMKNNVFDGLTININDKSATLTGKANYSVNGVIDNTNYAFNAWVQDNGTSGQGQDKFGLYHAKGNAVAGYEIRTSSTVAGTATSAKTLTGGNIQIPQPGGGK